ncbi:MAG: DMT family transporter [Myxococcota bacterium]
MPLHHTSGRHGLGFGLALTTMALWAVLPLALEGALRSLDVFTLTWARFAVSSVVLGGVLLLRRDLPRLRVGSARGWLLLAATGFLALNYGSYVLGLERTSAADAQVLIQAGPILLSLGGVFVFRERFTRRQWQGFAMLCLGLLVFIAARYDPAGADAERRIAGNLWIAFAAITWAIYGLAQKQLLRDLPSAHVLLWVYVGCTLAFTSLAEPSRIGDLNGPELWLLLFCALNTVVGYGAFAESLAHWEASRVGAVLALTPLGTLALAAIAEAWLPGWTRPQALGLWSWLGAVAVVAGSLVTSLAAPPPET